MDEASDISHELAALAWITGQHQILKNAGIRAKEWMQEADKEVSRASKPLDCLSNLSKHSMFCGDQKKLFILLRECILNHRWNEALKIGTTILDRKSYLSAQNVKALRRTMPEAVLHTGDEKGEAYHDFIRLTKGTLGGRGISEFEMNLDELIKYLDDDNIGAARDIVKSEIKYKNIFGQREYYKHQLTLYEGLLWYAEWHAAKQKRDDQEAEDELLFAGMSTPLEEAMKVHAAKAIQCFTTVKQFLHGTWDIFITRFATLLEYYEQDGKALELLEHYQEKNPGNPNARIYLYEYHKRHRAGDDVLLEILERIVKETPSLLIAFDLCEIYVKAGCKEKSIPVLFEMLDHVPWQDEIKPWALLANVLMELSDDDHETLLPLNKCWKERKDWWPAYHFHVRPEDGLGVNLVVHKAVVSTLLLGKDTKFVQSVLDMDLEASLKDRLLAACDKRLYDSVTEMDVDHTRDTSFQVFKL
ncbi:TATA box-binding protein-associated factor RNA polymerase I subunit A-like isoform X2 [Lineus longissimus]|uniref:TATA box-binding protein-associated factor RNA polymerase I subunit A-like isoform X2 n=1 Tax=Lineus longissimus TaxID=88925 RepID=UPI00315D3D5E